MSSLKSVNISTVEQIVIPKYNTSYTTVLCLKELIAALKNKADKTVEIVKDNAEEKAVEILIGRTNRTNVLSRGNLEDYVIEIIDGKITVDGGSVKALNFAVNLITEKVNAGELEITSISGKCDAECGKAAEYSEKFTDDFDGNKLDTDKWIAYTQDMSPETSRNPKDPNSKVILKRLVENNVVANGMLSQYVTIGEKIEEDGATTQVLYGAKMETSNSFCFRYGFTECSMKISSGDSMGPGFWLHGDRSEIGNYYCEFDICEFFGSPRFHHMSPLAWKVIAGDDGKRKNKSGWYLALKEGEIAREKHLYYLENYESFADSFHTFGLEWDEDYYRFTLDGEIVFEIKYSDATDDDVKRYGYTRDEILRCYRQPVYAIVSIFCGKYSWSTREWWPRNFPYEQYCSNLSNFNKNNWKDDNVSLVDYVIVYQKDGQLNGKTIADVNAQIK